MKEKLPPTAEQIIGITAIAKFMGYKPFTMAQWENYEAEVPNMYWVDYLTNYHNDWSLLMEVVEKIESKLYFFNSAPFIDDETNTLSGEYFCIVNHKSTFVDMPYLIDVIGCSSKIEATFKAVVEFLSLNL